MAQLYGHSLMLSIAIQSAPFSLIVLFSHSEPTIKTLKQLIQTNLTQNRLIQTYLEDTVLTVAKLLTMWQAITTLCLNSIVGVARQAQA